MTQINPYLNFNGECEAAFEFYKSVFGGEFNSVNRFGEMPAEPGMPPLSDELKNRIMHIGLPISEGQVLMGSDTIPGMGPEITGGTNFNIMVNPESLDEAKRIFNDLSDGGTISMPFEQQFWGDHFGSFIDKFGVLWMVNYSSEG